MTLFLVAGLAGVPLQTSQTPFVRDNILMGYTGDICGQDQAIAVDPSNSSRIAIAAGSWYWYSADGGVTWFGGALSMLAGDPSLAFDDAGNAFWGFNGQVGSRCDDLEVSYQGTAGLGVLKSADGGQSWSSVMLTSRTDLTELANDKDWIAVDRSGSQFHDRIYVVWNVWLNNTWNARHVLVGGTSGGVYLSYSDDHGATFSKPAKLALDFEMLSLQIATGPAGEVYLVGSIPYRGLNFLKSTDGGKSFGSIRRISNLADFPHPLTNTQLRTTNYPFPSLAVDQNNGNIYAAWVAAENGDGDIMLSRSSDGGNSWSSPTRVNDDPWTDHKDQLMPSVAISRDGAVHVAFVDRRDDPSNTAYNIYYAVSRDQGRTFSKNLRISLKASNPNLLHDPTFIGDYLGIASDNDGTVHVVWGGVGDDSAYSGLAIFEATMVYKPSVSASQITLSTMSTQSTHGSATQATTGSPATPTLGISQPPISPIAFNETYVAAAILAVALVAASVIALAKKRKTRPG